LLQIPDVAIRAQSIPKEIEHTLRSNKAKLPYLNKQVKNGSVIPSQEQGNGKEGDAKKKEIQRHIIFVRRHQSVWEDHKLSCAD